VYPILFRIGEFEVTSFGVMVGVAALVGLWLFARELRKSGLPTHASDAGLYGFIGGFVGAKLLYVVEHLGEEPFTDLLVARGGLSWYGGLAGGMLTGILVIVVRGLPIVPVFAAATPALAVGHLIGRIGYFLVGDDYGRPSSLPWRSRSQRGFLQRPTACIPRSCTRHCFSPCSRRSWFGGVGAACRTISCSRAILLPSARRDS
jgi:phosphatidylglycerol:prolipoprotein diacylglycerol transferase